VVKELINEALRGEMKAMSSGVRVASSGEGQWSGAPGIIWRRGWSGVRRKKADADLGEDIFAIGRRLL
jgi:hypothetical protein